MRARGSTSWTALVVMALLAVAALLLVTWLAKPVRDVAQGLARDWDIGRIGIVLAGIAAPLVFVGKKMVEWLARAFGLGSTARERRLEERTAAVEAELRRLGEEVRAIDAGRRETLARHHAELAALEQRMGPIRAEYDELGARLEARRTAPPPTLAELERWLEQQPGYRDAP